MELYLLNLLFILAHFNNNVLFSILISKILKFRNKSHWGTVYVLSLIISICINFSAYTITISPTVTYVFLTLLYVLHVFILFEGSVLLRLSCAFMAIIHLLSMSASIWAVVSLVGGHSLLTISSNPTYLIIIRVIVATICSTEMGLVLRNTSPESFQLIGRNHQRIKMLFLKLFFLLIVLIANSSFFNESWFKREIFLYQVVFGLCMIGVFYTALRLMIQYEATDKELTTQVECEGLTGLYNKMTTEKLISEFIETKQDGVLFMVDLDNFKAINDNLGHDKGDQVLQEMATELKAIFADADVIGRVGGDEFIIYFKTSVPNLHDKVLNVHKNLTKTYSDGHINVTVSASLGIANVMDDTTTFKELYRFADIALYQSKKRGKNTFTIYNDITPELHPTK